MSENDPAKKGPAAPVIPGFDMEAWKKQAEAQMAATMQGLQGFDMKAYLEMAQTASAQMAEALYGKDELNLDPDSTLTPVQSWAIAVGATLAQRNRHPLNTLKTTLDSIEAQASLAEWWEIEDPQGARETLTWLQDGGHRIYFNPIIALEARGLQGEELQTALLQHDAPLGQEPGTLVEYYKKYRAGLRYLKKAGVLAKDATVRSIDAWDFGRLVNVCRWCHDAG